MSENEYLALKQELSHAKAILHQIAINTRPAELTYAQAIWKLEIIYRLVKAYDDQEQPHD